MIILPCWFWERGMFAQVLWPMDLLSSSVIFWGQLAGGRGGVLSKERGILWGGGGVGLHEQTEQTHNLLRMAGRNQGTVMYVSHHVSGIPTNLEQ